ncbi:MAG: toxic anion resistance protein [Clostridia bacterium]|nr:toxic anion resistance protein [Clostridia bacterium]
MSDFTMPEIELTLDTEPEAPKPELVVPETKAKELVKEVVQQQTFTPEEQRMIDSFAEKINIKDSNMVLKYGSNSQKKIASFSETALQNVRTKDLGEVGGLVTDLVNELKGFSTEEKERGILGFFKRQGNKIAALKTKYDKVEVNVDKIAEVLEGHQLKLMKDIAMLDKMYDLNLIYFKELTMYIAAGKKKLEQLLATELPRLKEKAAKSGLPEDAQAANDFAAKCNNFEKKIHDLELTRMISIQMAPQIRLIQNNDSMMTEKIQSTIVNTIPLWKSQMVLALGLAHSQEAIKAQREVTDMTNALLRKNADALKMGTIEAAKESERGIVDIETLKHTNESLISTLDEVLRIQDEGRQKRRDAENELGRIENELKQKLLEVRG